MSLLRRFLNFLRQESTPTMAPPAVGDAPVEITSVTDLTELLHPRAIPTRSMESDKGLPDSPRCAVYVATTASDEIAGGAVRVGLRFLGSEIRTTDPDLVRRLLAEISSGKFTCRNQYRAFIQSVLSETIAAKLAFEAATHLRNSIALLRKTPGSKIKALTLARIIGSQRAFLEAALARTELSEELGALIKRESDRILIEQFEEVLSTSDHDDDQLDTNVDAIVDWYQKGLSVISALEPPLPGLGLQFVYSDKTTDDPPAKFRLSKSLSVDTERRPRGAHLITSDKGESVASGIAAPPLTPDRGFSPDNSDPLNTPSSFARSKGMPGAAPNSQHAVDSASNKGNAAPSGPEPILVVTFLPTTAVAVPLGTVAPSYLLRAFQGYVAPQYWDIAYSDISSFGGSSPSQEEHDTVLSPKVAGGQAWRTPPTTAPHGGETQDGGGTSRPTSREIWVSEAIRATSGSRGRSSEEAAATKRHRMIGESLGLLATEDPISMMFAADLIPALMEYGGKLPFESMVELANRRSRFHKFVVCAQTETGRATVLSQTIGAITFSVETVSLVALRGDYERLDFAGRINFLARLVKFADTAWTMEIKITSAHLAQHHQTILKTIRSWFEEGKLG